jgi:hypothetical protein
MFGKARLDEAARRVLALQAELAEKSDIIPTLTKEEEELIEFTARDCITAINDEGVSPSLGDIEKTRLFVIVTPMGFKDDGLTDEVTMGNWYFPKKIAKKIESEFPNGEVIFVPEYATQFENEKVLLAATRHSEVIFVTFCHTAPYLGTDCMTRRTEALINSLSLSGKVKALVHFGNPYAVQPINHIERVLLGYSSPASQEYAIEVLSGKLEAKGHLPFDIKLK